jgi:hypothetical protein
LMSVGYSHIVQNAVHTASDCLPVDIQSWKKSTTTFTFKLYMKPYRPVNSQTGNMRHRTWQSRVVIPLTSSWNDCRFFFFFSFLFFKIILPFSWKIVLLLFRIFVDNLPAVTIFHVCASQQRIFFSVPCWTLNSRAQIYLKWKVK